METTAPTIEDWGYGEFFESSLAKLGPEGLLPARVIAEHKGAYKVASAKGEYLAKITGKQMFTALSREDYPAVGDWVAIAEADQSNAVIRAVLPRKTVIKRIAGDSNKSGAKTQTQVIGANIDVAFVVESIGRDYNLNRFERYFVLARDSGVAPAIILNKADLISPDELDAKLAEIKNRFSGVDVIATSVVSEQGLDELKKYILPRKTYCFLGSSGVGKSSLINRLAGEEVSKTGGISAYSGRGKHVTTRREMFVLANGGIVIDNPGMREVGLAAADAAISDSFDEIASLAEGCQFSDCSHIHEPGCAVLAALNDQSLDRGRYDNYLAFKKETEFRALTEYQKRQRGRSFSKFIKKAKSELEKYD